MKTKKCSKCKLEYFRTLNGRIARMYSDMKYRIKRGHVPLDDFIPREYFAQICIACGVKRKSKANKQRLGRS